MAFESDLIPTNSGNLEITFIGHGTLMLSLDNSVIHIDPVPEMADYTKLPKGDIILITHGHPDHFNIETIDLLRKRGTTVVLPEIFAWEVKNCVVLKNGDSLEVHNLLIEAVPAYGVVQMRSPGTLFHPRGEGNGYVITFGDKRVYIAGDTENIPEMKQLEAVDVAFLPMNLPYTMTPEMAADAALMIRPKILYPYHFGNSDTLKLVDLLKNYPEIEIRIRNLQ